MPSLSTASPLVIECRGTPPDAPDAVFVAAFCDALEERFAVLEPDIPVVRGDVATAIAAGDVHVRIDLGRADRYGLTAILTLTAQGRTERQEVSLTSFDATPDPGMAGTLLLPILRMAGLAR